MFCQILNIAKGEDDLHSLDDFMPHRCRAHLLYYMTYFTRENDLIHM